MSKATVRKLPAKIQQRARSLAKLEHLGRGGFEYRVMMLVRKKKATRGNPYHWICVAIGNKHLKRLFR